MDILSKAFMIGVITKVLILLSLKVSLAFCLEDILALIGIYRKNKKLTKVILLYSH